MSFLLLLFAVPSFPLQSAPAQTGLSDEELLETIQENAFYFFLMEHDKKTGLVRDRAPNFKRSKQMIPASIAATGFALTAYPVGVEHDWMDRGMAVELTRRTLQFFLKYAPQEHGFFYHFLDMQTGDRWGKSELSPIDTALLLAGALFAAEYYEDPQIRDLAYQIYERVDWKWMLHEGDTLALAWSPEQGFNKLRWDHYDESMIMYLLAIGSPTHPIPAESWHKISRPVGSYKGYHVIQIPPLFTHQYSHVWVDFRNKNDGHADYFQNSVNATKANRAFCIDQASKYSSYGPNSWGLTASDGPFGYKAYGAPPGWAEHDGTVAPTACGGSIVFTPEESIACLRYFYENLSDKLWGQYGFADSFNLDKNWVATDVIGIDQGPIVLMIENYRTELIWNVMKKNTYLQDAMNKVGFKEGTMELPWPDPPEHPTPYVFGGLAIDGFLRDWPNGAAILLDETLRESGVIDGDKDLKGEVRFAWDEDNLYFYVKVQDDDILVRKSGRNIWQDDLLELYIDPAGDGLYWYDRNDFQIGFRAEEDGERVQTWSWFQGGEDPQEKAAVAARGYVDAAEYLIEGAIRWDYLGIKPKAGETVRVSPALHDIDRDRKHGKAHWFFRSEDDIKRFVLGKLILTKTTPEAL